MIKPLVLSNISDIIVRLAHTFAIGSLFIQVDQCTDSKRSYSIESLFVGGNYKPICRKPQKYMGIDNKKAKR